MIGQSIPEYLLIRACITVLRLVAPASTVYLGVSWFRGGFLFSRWIGLWAIAESAFCLFVYVPRRKRLQKAATHPPLLDRAERQAHFEKCVAHMRGSVHTAGWFFSAPSEDIKRENAIEWLLWALFSCSPQDCLPEWEDELDGYVKIMERSLEHSFDEGRNPDIPSMRLTLDPVLMIHRPLLWYMIVAIVDTASSIAFYFMGFRHYATKKWFTVFPPRPLTVFSRKSQQLPYWYRPHQSKTKLPIVFVHGIGIGFWPYIPFIWDIISQDPDVGILAIEILPVSMRITAPPLGRESMCRAIHTILDSQNISRFVVISHSYGTVVTSHMLHSDFLADRIAACLIIDPIPFLLHLPAVAYNFVYRRPRQANEWQLWYFASRDPDISRALSRHFFWSENILWKEELEGKDVTVVLSGADQIVDTEEVRWYLTGEEKAEFRWRKDELEVLFYPGLDHAVVFDNRETRRPLLEAVHRFVRR